jgi:small-conductance mechanosensitive channel/CRP-like cAMP-binding protein
VLKGLEPVLPFIQNIALAAALLLAAYLLTIPLRRRYGPSYGAEPKRRSGRQFVGALLNYLAFSIVVLVPSIPLIWWLNRVEEPGDWPLYYQAWLSFWIIHLMIRFAEGLFVEIFVQLGRACPFTRLSRGLLRLALMLGVAFMLIKYQLRFDIAVLLTSTAIVTGVIGFAMQGVLGNLLAGMSLHASRSMALGDWIDVDGTIGKVILVNWRETRLRTLGGHMVIVPNGKLADLTVRNFSSPTSLRRHEVPVAASYGDAPGDVIAALIEAAQSVPTVEKHPAPDAYVTGFKDFCIEYVLRFWSRQYEQYMMIEGDVMRMIWYKFNRRGIEIPFPMSGRLLGNFLEAVHAQKFEKPLASEIERVVDDLLRSDFGRKLMADSEGICRLSRDELRAVARNVKRTYFTCGETLMRQNDDGESFYVLVQGKVHGSIENSDTARNVEFELQSGALFGEMSLLTGLPRSATMTAVTDCELLEFDRTAFTHLLSLREEIPQVLSDLAAARARENAESLEKLRASAVVPPVLARDGILHRLSRMVGEWRARRTR